MSRGRIVRAGGAQSLLGDFAGRVAGEVDIPRQAPPGGVGVWAQQVGIVLDRGLFTFKRHEYLVVPYADDHPKQVERKCAQMGNTIRALLTVFHLALFAPIVGVLYLFPSKRGSGTFVSTRVNPLLEYNPNTLGKWVLGTDSIEVKRLAGTNLLFRGTRSTEALRSDPVDEVVYDEFDLFPVGIEATARERMGHSDLKREHYLSNPTLPDFGIDLLIQRTDRRRWLLKCPACGAWTDVIGEWERQANPRDLTAPDILREYPDGRVELVCAKCHDAALNRAVGEWVSMHPSVTESRGYEYSQLFSQYVSAQEILHQFRTTLDMGAFYNYKLGLPYVEAENRASIEEVLRCCGSHGIASSDHGPNYMGIDQGKGLHAVIGDGSGMVKHLGEYRDWSDLDRLMREFGVVRCVVDAMPEMRAAREFAARHPGRVFLNFYSKGQRGAAAWDEKNLKVAVNRTESMDASHQVIIKGWLKLPRRCKVVEDFALHAHNTARKLEEDDETGSKQYTWVKLGPDHFRHALNYYVIAADYASNSYFAGADW